MESMSVSQSSVTTPTLVREARNLTNFTFEKDPFNSNLPLSEPLTPLESKLKDIILNVYCDSPVTPTKAGTKPANVKDVSDDNHSTSEEDNKGPSPQNQSFSFPKHILSSSRMSLYSTEGEEHVFNPIFSADDNLTVVDPPSNNPSISQFTGIHSAFSTLATNSSGTMLPLITPNDVYSPDDVEAVTPPPKHAPNYFSVPSDVSERRFPGFPERVSNKSPVQPENVSESSSSGLCNGTPPSSLRPSPPPVILAPIHNVPPPKPPEHLRPRLPRFQLKHEETSVLPPLKNEKPHPLVLPVLSSPTSLSSTSPSPLPLTHSSIPSSTHPLTRPLTSPTISSSSAHPSIPSSTPPLTRPLTPATIPSSTPLTVPSSTHPSIPSSIPPSTCSSISLPLPSTRPSVPTSTHPLTRPSTHPSVPLPLPSTRPSIPTSTHPLTRPSTHPSVPLPLPSTRPSIPTSTHQLLHSPKSSLPLVNPPNLHSPLLSTLPVSIDSKKDDLRKQVNQLLKEKMNLEGQLESMVQECQLALQDRAQLQMQLSQAEGKFKGSVQPILPPQLVGGTQPEGGNGAAGKIDLLESTLRSKQQETDALSSENTKLKQQVENMYTELGNARQEMEEKNTKLHEMNMESSTLKTEMGEKCDAIEALTNQIARLQASFESMESGKKWLHDQLQDAIQSKVKLQEELRGVKATSYTSGAKLRQLEQENELLSGQVSKLQNKMLQDKASLVSNLEEIEEDVLLRETLFAEMEDKHKQMEEVVQLKNNQMKEMRERTEKDQEQMTDMELKLSDLTSSTQLQAMQVKNLEDEGNVVKQELELLKAAVKRKDEELEAVRKDKGTLQQQLKHVNASLITKEGDLQTFKDLSEMNSQQAQTVNATLEKVEAECGATQKKLAERDSKVASMESKMKQLSSELEFMKRKSLQDAALLEAAKATLLDKENELDEKVNKVASMEGDISHVTAENELLRSQLDATIKEALKGREKAGRDTTQLLSENDWLRSELTAAKSDSTALRSSLNDTNRENQQLQSQLEAMVNNDSMAEELKQAIQKKTDMEVELERLKDNHCLEMSKGQAKIAKLSEEIEQLKEECENDKELEQEIESLKEQIATKGNLSPIQENKLSSEISSLQSLLNQRDNELNTVSEHKDQLNQELLDLNEQLVEEQNQISELEQEKCDMTVELEGYIERENELNEEVQSLIIDNERLKGRLAGTDRAQTCLREHLRDIESSMADKEVEFTNQLSKNAALVSQKEREIEQLESHINDLQDTLDDWKAELEKVLTEKLLDKQRANNLERTLQEKEALLSQIEEMKDNSKLQDTVNDLQEENKLLQSEVGTLKQNLSLFHTTHECTKRELDEKTTMASVLTKKTELMETQLAQSKEEITAIEDKLRRTEIQYKKEMNTLLTSQSSIGLHGGLSDREGIDGDLSSFTSDDDSNVSYRNDAHLLHQAQLDEFKGKLVKARKEGEELAEKKVFGEMKSLRNQVGTKSKTLRTLQDCVSSLREDMTAVEFQLNMQSPNLSESIHSARNIEGKINQLHQNQSSDYS